MLHIYPMIQNGSWFKQTATWFLDDKITDEEFTHSVKYLRDMGLIQPH